MKKIDDSIDDILELLINFRTVDLREEKELLTQAKQEIKDIILGGLPENVWIYTPGTGHSSQALLYGNEIKEQLRRAIKGL